MGLLQRLNPFRKPSEDDFARIVGQALSELTGEDPKYEREEFRLVRSDGAFLFLGNAYADYLRASTGERKLIVERYAQLAANTPDIPSTWEEAAPRLMPVVRDLGYYANIARSESGASLDTTRAPFVGTLVADLVVDTEQAMAMVNPDAFEDWGGSREEAMEQALHNLRRASDADFVELQPGIYQSNYGDAYDSSRILLPDVLHRLGLAGDPVVVAPVRDMLLVTGDRAAALAELPELAERVMDGGGRPLAFQAIVHRDGSWGLFDPPEGDPLRLAFARLRLLDVLRSYQEQKAQLDTTHEAQGVDLFVASYQARKLDDGTLETFCVWTRDVDTLLPMTDRVFLVLDPAGPKSEENFFVVSWADVMEVTGELLERVPEMWPVRYRARAFPEGPALEVLRAKART